MARTNMKTAFRRFSAAILLLLVANLALAASESPAPPQEVFRYVVYDTGDAFEIDWAVDDGAYMYRQSFAFESGDPSIVLGAPELPEGEVHTDEYFGEQIVYRNNFFVRIPYSAAEEKPAKKKTAAKKTAAKKTAAKKAEDSDAEDSGEA